MSHGTIDVSMPGEVTLVLLVAPVILIAVL